MEWSGMGIWKEEFPLHFNDNSILRLDRCHFNGIYL